MDYNLADFAQQMAPTQQQALMADILRRKQRGDGQEALAAQHAKATQFDQMAAVAPLMNNPAVLQSATAAQKMAASAHKPVQLGQQGFVVPESGEFVASPIYEDEKNAARQAAKDAQEAREEAKRSALQQTLEAKRERDAMLEAGRNERAAENRALRQTLAAMGAGNKTDKEALKKSQELEKAVTKYSTQLEKSGVPEFDEALRIAEGRLGLHKPGELPGFGRFEGGMHDALLSKEAQMARADMQQAANILLKLRSGAAVTDPEMRRFLTEVMQGAGRSEEALRHGWANVRRAFDAKRSAIAAGASPEVHEEFLARGGTDFRPQKKEEAPSKPKRIRYDANGEEIKQ